MAMIFDHNLPRKGYNTGEYIGSATLNALRDDNQIGDERYNFVKVRKQGERKFKKAVKTDVGDKLTVRIYFHNNADRSLKAEGKGSVLDAKITSTYGTLCCFEDEWEAYANACEGKCHGIMGYIDSSNNDPKRVQDFCVVNTPNSTTINNIIGSARITTKRGTQVFPDKGGLVNIGKVAGEIPPGEFGYVEEDYVVVKTGD